MPQKCAGESKKLVSWRRLARMGQMKAEMASYARRTDFAALVPLSFKAGAILSSRC